MDDRSETKPVADAVVKSGSTSTGASTDKSTATSKEPLDEQGYVLITLDLPPALASLYPLAVHGLASSGCQPSATGELYFVGPGVNQILVRTSQPEEIVLTLGSMPTGQGDALVKRCDQVSETYAFLWLTRWIHSSYSRFECNGDLAGIRAELFNAENCAILYEIYKDQLLKPDADFVISNLPACFWEQEISSVMAAVNRQCQQIQFLRDGRKGDGPVQTIDIVIPAYGKPLQTLLCVSSVLKDVLVYRDRLIEDFEVYVRVVDDCHPEAEGHELLAQLNQTGVITFTINPKNLGFLRTCRNAIDCLPNPCYICLLNNDTFVLPGWLISLVETYEQEDGVGIVGSKLLFPDGTLQEAGGIVWNNASAWNFGRGDQPGLPEYSFLRDVDYVSGASILFRSDVWRQLGGFDDRYAPAYYEDTDLCMAARDLGLKVLFQPLSQVIHYEGLSSGSDTAGRGVKKHQVQNKRRFLFKWQKRLAQYQNNGARLWQAQNRDCCGSALVIEDLLLTPTLDAGSFFMMNNCLALRALGYTVSYIPADNYCYMADQARSMGARGIEVLAHPRLGHVHDLSAFKGQRPVEHQRSFDVIIVARPRNAGYIQALREAFPGALIMYYTHDLHHLRLLRQSRACADREEALALHDQSLRMKEIETQIFAAADVVLHVSKQEEAVAQSLVEHCSVVLNPPHAAASARTARPQQQSLMFLGSFRHPPNREGLLWFLEQVWPILHRLMPSCCLHVVGSDPPDELLVHASESVRFLGYVSDLSPVFSACVLGIAPLLSGAGVKGKVLSCLGAGLPMVGTAIAAEGILESGAATDFFSVADSPDEFAQSIAAMLRLPEQRFVEVSSAAQSFVRETYGASGLLGSIKQALAMADKPFNSDVSEFGLYAPRSTDCLYGLKNSFAYYSSALARRCQRV